MKGDLGKDIPIKNANFSIRSPLAVLVLMPFYLPLVLAIFTICIVFTVWPDALQHSPIGGFESEGLVHHIWHYSMFAGSMLTLVGMFWTSIRRLTTELAGVFILLGSLTMNLTAVVALALSPGDAEEPSGLGMALRAGVILGLAVRAYTIIFEPAVALSTAQED